MNLFQKGNVKLHSGEFSSFKIDCDALTEKDWECLAFMASQILPPYGKVEGIPSGGLKFAKALEKYKTDGPLLVADDVLTTGKSMEDYLLDREDTYNVIGIVVFNRGKLPRWVKSIFDLNGKL